ncbi:hypothetical protein GS597_04540 [Synechococcales cyanobacterium C]|uniref:Uncharacterized protein n=1 Tax=Petrachloros mirabilis ULC683 TaxID=2781853 RepID=A0A8K1ZXA4_9CYAN|nr:hypothetical protein [Petrachloros mirabilis]NCJ05787.1 hypothetical protein [Petrachloros mirabilis ULC683]
MEQPNWQLVASLLQPALIRLIDQLGQQMSPWGWQGEYETQEHWPAETRAEQKQQVKTLRQQWEAAAPEIKPELERQLFELPQPLVSYVLYLERDGLKAHFNLWELCYQICLESYTPQLDRQGITDLPMDQIQVDAQLLDDQGEIDWNALDQKAAQVVTQAFQSLQPQEEAHS